MGFYGELTAIDYAVSKSLLFMTQGAADDSFRTMQTVEAKEERPLVEQTASFQVFSLDLLQGSTKSR